MDRQIQPEDVEPSEVTARFEAELAEAKLRTFEHARRQEVAKSTDQQVHEAVESLRGIPELRPEVWRGLDASQRLHVAQEVEERMATIHGRPPAEVRVEQLDPGVNGKYSPTDGRIRISPDVLHSDEPHTAMFTVIHEGRHAYQHYAITHPGFHPVQGEVELWKWNMRPDHYLTPEKAGMRAYMNQPIEVDANTYAFEIVRKVAMGGPR